MANPRIDDLRKKLEKEPGSRLFAQLAEELRKDGDLAESIRVARQGLAQHPNYPSARMTLGRALLDSGDLQAARKEFEAVLKGAADNILASRFLAECLEGLGLTADALQRYRATLAMAPGDKQLQARIQALEKAAAAPAAPRPAEPPAAAAAVVPAAAEEAEPPPIRLVEVDGPMELVTRFEEAHPPVPMPLEPAADIYIAQPEEEARPQVAPEPAEAPLPLVPVDEEEFELERAYDAVPVVVRPLPAEGTAPPPVPPAASLPLVADDDEPILEADAVEEGARAEPAVPAMAAQPAAEGEPAVEPDVIDEEFEVEPPPAAGPPRVTFRDILTEPGVSAAALAAARQAETPAEPAPAAPAPPAAPLGEPTLASPRPPELASPTLAELYFDQGFPDKAVEVYRKLLQREPENERLRRRMREIEAAPHSAPAVAAAAWPAGSRQEAIGRAIERLQGLRAALARRD